MSLAAQSSETTYALAGTALGPFNSVWTCAALGEVGVTLNVGGTSTVLTGGGTDFTAAGATPLVSGADVTLQAHCIPGGGNWPANSSVTLRRVTANGQPSTYGEAIGFSPAACESALDTIARQVQECETRLARTARAQPGEHLDPLPNAIARASSVLGFDATGAAVVGLLQHVGSSYFRPSTSGDTTLGAATKKWSTVYATTGAINTSDERAKQDIGPIPDLVLDAWENVAFVQFRLIDEVAGQGEAAKIHVGAIAQQIVQAFAAYELDALAYGVVTLDRWEASEDGPAGEAYGVRYDQALVLEAALTRRELWRLRQRVSG